MNLEIIRSDSRRERFQFLCKVHEVKAKQKGQPVAVSVKLHAGDVHQNVTSLLNDTHLTSIVGIHNTDVKRFSLCMVNNQPNKTRNRLDNPSVCHISVTLTVQLGSAPISRSWPTRKSRRAAGELEPRLRWDHLPATTLREFCYFSTKLHGVTPYKTATFQKLDCDTQLSTRCFLTHCPTFLVSKLREKVFNLLKPKTYFMYRQL